MDVAGGRNRLFELLSQLHNLAVQIFQILLGLNVRQFVALQHELIVPQRLDLIVIVKIRQLGDGLLGLFI